MNFNCQPFTFIFIAGQVLQRLHGHLSDVVNICVDQNDEDVVGSLSDDGVFKQWRLKPIEDNLNSSGTSKGSYSQLSLSLKRRSVRRDVKYLTNPDLDSTEMLSSIATSDTEVGMS